MMSDTANFSEVDAPLLASPLAARKPVSVVWVVLVLTAVQASFGGNAVVIKLALTANADPIVFSFLRDVGGAAALLLACKVRGCLVWPRRADLGAFILLGVLGVYIGMMFQTLALQYVEPLNTALLQPSQPVLTTFLAAVFGFEALSLATLHGRLKLGGVLVSAAGAVYTVYYSSQQRAHDIASTLATVGAPSSSVSASALASAPAPPPSASRPTAPELVLGNALLVVQCVSGALYQLLQKHLLSHADYPPLSVAAMGYLIGAIAVGLVIPVCSVREDAWSFLWTSPTAGFALAYAILMTSAFNYGLQAFANKHSSPTLVTAFFPLQIVFTALFSYAANGKRPATTDYVGGLLIIAGLAAVTTGRALHARHGSKTTDQNAAMDAART